MRRRRARLEPRPWAAEEDAKLREICEIGLASDWWHFALPGRTFGEIVERRLDLGIETADRL